jgi:hypothetical protein
MLSHIAFLIFLDTTPPPPPGGGPPGFFLPYIWVAVIAALGYGVRTIVKKSNQKNKNL